MVSLGIMALAVAGIGGDAIEARFVEPSSYSAAVGESIELRLGGAGDAAWPGLDVQWMFVRVAATQRNFDDPPLDEAGRLWLALDRAGVGMIGIDLAPRVEDVSLAKLDAFVVARGRAHADAPAVHGARGAVRRVESMKTVVRAGAVGAESGATAATGKSGQAVEIRPLMDPAATPPGSDVAFRAYVRGSGAAGARVIATHEATGAVQDILCNESGIGNIRITAAGAWRVELHELRAGEGDEPWALYSATLTFEASPELPRAGGQ